MWTRLAKQAGVTEAEIAEAILMPQFSGASLAQARLLRS